ncbi:MAG: thiamine ABC transporter substrate-binding protein [Psittacicella sp.]
MYKFLKYSLLLTAALPIYSFASNVLNVYTYSSFIDNGGPGKTLAKIFQKQTGVKVNFKSFGSFGITLDHVYLFSKNSNADVVLGFSSSYLQKASRSNLFLKLNPSILNSINLPIKWTNSTFIPYDYSYMSFNYQGDLTLPNTLQKLIYDKDIPIIYQNPQTSSLGRSFISLINSTFPKSEQPAIYKELAKHTREIATSGTQSYEALMHTKNVLVFGYSTTPYYLNYQNSNNHYKALFLKSGNIVQFEYGAILKSSKNKKAALEFIKFLLSKKAQAIISKDNVMLSVTKGATYKPFKTIVSGQYKAIYPSINLSSQNAISIWETNA